jgi:hypothetical protein
LKTFFGFFRGGASAASKPPFEKIHLHLSSAKGLFKQSPIIEYSESK